MTTGTFPKAGAGTAEDPFRPDFHSGPDAIAADEIGIFLRRVSKTATTVTVEYRKRKRTRIETLRKKRRDGQVLSVVERTELLDILLGV